MKVYSVGRIILKMACMDCDLAVQMRQLGGNRENFIHSLEPRSFILAPSKSAIFDFFHQYFIVF